MTNLFKFKTPSDSTGFLLWKTTHLWQRALTKALKRFDLTHTQFVILASSYWLVSHGENITQVEIANFIGIDKMMTSNVIKKLLEKKLLKRTAHKTDTRAKVINLTDNGKQVLKKAIIAVEEFDQSFFGALAEQDTFNQELLRLMDNNGAESIKK